jgi:hypothetical protein
MTDEATSYIAYSGPFHVDEDKKTHALDVRLAVSVAPIRSSGQNGHVVADLEAGRTALAAVNVRELSARWSPARAGRSPAAA